MYCCMVTFLMSSGIFIFAIAYVSVFIFLQLPSEDRLAAVFVVGFSLAGSSTGLVKFRCLTSIELYEVGMLFLQRMGKVMNKWY